MPPQSNALPPGFQVKKPEKTDQKADGGGTATLPSNEVLEQNYREYLGNFKKQWNSMTRAEREAATKDLSPTDLMNLYSLERSIQTNKGPTTVSAAPEFKASSVGSLFKGPLDPWMKQKEMDIAASLLRFLPTAGGNLGGWGGRVGGAALGALVGAEPVGYTVGGAGGAFLGGAAGEGLREAGEHALGWDRFEDWTPERRWKEIRNQGIAQAGGELIGQALTKAMTPTLQRAISKLYFAGGFEHGPDPFGPGNLETIMPELLKAEKLNPVRDVRDLTERLIDIKRDIGNQVDAAYLVPITQGNRQVALGKATANSQPLTNAVDRVLADLNINPDINKNAIREVMKMRTLALKPRTYEQLADWRIAINRRLSSFYQMNPGVKAITLDLNPELAAEKEIADAIRDSTYPEMDRALQRVNPSHQMGETKILQEKRGAAIALEDQARSQMRGLLTQSKYEAGKSPLKRGNFSGYITSHGKGGAGLHRVTSIIHAPNVLTDADKRAASAFGHTLPQKVFRGMTKNLPLLPTGVTVARDVPLYMATPPRKVNENPVDVLDRLFQAIPTERTPSLPQLQQQAKQFGPQASGAKKSWKHYYQLPTGETVVSDDGQNWTYFESGKPYQGEYQ